MNAGVMVLALIGLAAVALSVSVVLVMAVDRMLDWWHFRRALNRMKKEDLR